VCCKDYIILSNSCASIVVFVSSAEGLSKKITGNPTQKTPMDDAK
jgi:hypothetical protein